MKTDAELTDSELLRAFARGVDEGAFTALVRRHGGLVFGVALRRTGDWSLAEETAQAAFALLASLTAHGAEICPSSICKPSPRYCEPLLIERVDCPVCPVCTTPAPPRRATPRPPARVIVKPVAPRSDPPAPRKGECPK